MEKYKIVRIYHPDLQKFSKVIKKGLTLEQVQKHCSDPKTSTKNWFDGYVKEGS
jgi:hypothetical protein